MIGGELVLAPPHNWYVEAFLRLGAVGLFLLARMYFLGMQRLKRLPRELRGTRLPGRSVLEACPAVAIVLFLDLWGFIRTIDPYRNRACCYTGEA